MDNIEDQVFSEWEMNQLFSDNLPPWDYRTNLCLLRGFDSPSNNEQPLNLLTNARFSLPSPATLEGFVVSAEHLPYGSLDTSNATGAKDFSVAAYPGPCQSQWSGMSSSLTHGTYASVPQPQNQYQPLLCGRSRDLEPCPVPLPSNPQSLSSMLPPSYSDEYQHDAWTRHVLEGNSDTCTSSPDADTALSASGFLGAFADFDSLWDAPADPQPSVALAHNLDNVISSVQYTPLPCSEPICGSSDRQTRIFECQWLGNGVSCDMPVIADRRSVVKHLQRTHGIKPGEEKIRQTCLWEGCTRVLNTESLARHILTVHLKEKVHCAECGLFFAREDSLKRHLKGGQHKVVSDKSAARPPRNHTGFR